MKLCFLYLHFTTNHGKCTKKLLVHCCFLNVSDKFKVISGVLLCKTCHISMKKDHLKLEELE